MLVTLTACVEKSNKPTDDKDEDITTAITKEEWNSAFGVENFLKDAKIVYTQNVQASVQENTLLLSGNECSSYSVIDIFTKNGKKSSESIRINIVGNGYEDYYSKESNDDSGTFTEGNWTYTLVDTYDYTANNYAYWKEYVLNRVNYNYLSKIVEQYSKFTVKSDKFNYHESSGIVLESSHEEDDGVVFNSSITASDITVTIANKKITSISMTCKYLEELTGAGDENYKENIDFTISYSFTYGPQTVEAPSGVKPQE